MSIDLKRWNLTIPIDAKRITTEELNGGYADEFFIRNEDGTITFRAPSDQEGVKSTPNSTYPRSELRETLENGDDKECDWPIASSKEHVLKSELKVDKLAASGKAIIGQWHGQTHHPLFKFQITRTPKKKAKPESTNIYVQLRRQLDGVEDKVIVYPNYALGTWFTYEARLSSEGKLKIFIDDTQVVNDVLLEDGYQYDMDTYAYEKLFAKVGMYSQEKVGGKGTGVITFRNFQQEHVAHDPVRTLADLAQEVSSLLTGWQAGSVIRKDCLDSIQRIKEEADTEFEKGEDRTSLYTQIKDARATIRGEYSTSAQGEGIANKLAELETNMDDPDTLRFKISSDAGLLDQIDSLPDGPEQVALRNRAKAILINRV